MNTTYLVSNNIIDISTGFRSSYALSKDGLIYSWGLNQYGQLGIGNTVSKNIFVDEPLPYKMYINDIDYDVIKSFDNYTGWDIKK